MFSAANNALLDKPAVAPEIFQKNTAEMSVAAWRLLDHFSVTIPKIVPRRAVWKKQDWLAVVGAARWLTYVAEAAGAVPAIVVAAR